MNGNGNGQAAPAADRHRGGDEPDDLRASEVVVDPRGTRVPENEQDGEQRPGRRKRHWLRYLVLALILAAIVALGIVYGLPWLVEYMNTVSTDDAYVQGHVTNLGARIPDVVEEVLVEESDHVEAGEVLIRLDREPFALQVAQAEADLDQARAALEETRAQVRGLLEQARTGWYRYQGAREETRRLVAQLDADVASLRRAESDRRLAVMNYRRFENLEERGSATEAELDERRNELEVAEQAVEEAKAQINATRAALGLKTAVEDPLDLPDDLVERQPSVEASRASVAAALAEVGLPVDLLDAGPDDPFGRIIGVEEGGDVEAAFDRLIDEAPQTKEAKARIAQAERRLDDAELNLSYTEIRSPIDGYVERRSAHPGDRVQPGQALLTIRPAMVWIDANFKETELHDLVIGQPVELHVDAYPDRVFRGRIAGFSPATGAASALLPPENATGNFVKIVQRLPVRIELTEPPPADTPLFAGLSVIPKVRLDAIPTGPDAGKRLTAPGAPIAPSYDRTFATAGETLGHTEAGAGTERP